MSEVLKAVKMEIKFLCENELDKEDILAWVLDALEKFADFESPQAKILEMHDNVLCKPGEELAEA
jgi:hypothetical protein